jgi:hypothetical protein
VTSEGNECLSFVSEFVLNKRVTRCLALNVWWTWAVCSEEFFLKEDIWYITVCGTVTVAWCCLWTGWVLMVGELSEMRQDYR